MAIPGRNAYKVAVLEDNDELREQILLPGLRRLGFDATGAASAIELYRNMLRDEYAMVVLDIGLPDEDGISVARHLREAYSQLGIVMLSVGRHDTEKIEALNGGADLFLTKPINIEVLAASLHSLYRRLHEMPEQEAEPRESRPAAAPVQESAPQDTAVGWYLHALDGSAIALSGSERNLLQLLLKVSPQPVMREDLIACLTDDVYNFDPHRLDVVVHRLRRKLALSEWSHTTILTIRQVGYALVVQQQAEA